MNIILVIKCYITVNILIALTSVFTVMMTKIGRFFSRKITFQHLLKLTYALTLASMALPILMLDQMHSDVWTPRAQIWSAFQAKQLTSNSAAESSQVAISLGTSIAPVQLDYLAIAFTSIIAVGVLLVSRRIYRDHKNLNGIIRECFVARKIGRVSILVSDAPLIPFAAWMPRRAIVVVPSQILERRSMYQVIVRHELQHHRQNDTKWIYALQVIKAMCFWNPFVLLLQKSISEIQEVACDEALTGPQRISSSAYCDCLLWVAQNTLQIRTHLIGTAGFARGSAAKLLKWRFEEMLNLRTKHVSRFGVALVGIAAVGCLSVAAAATHSSIQDRRISLADAQQMAEVARSNEFPIVVNDLVLDQLNRFIGTPDGREFMRKSLDRMKIYQDTVYRFTEQYQLPRELAAIPIIESGYRNLPTSGVSEHGAGIWMFIAPTARSFNLRVDQMIDERLDPRLETDAAMRLLRDLNQEFDDWGLALLSYNYGVKAVKNAIQNTGSRDVWTLIRAGYENDPRYVASIMATVLIMKNPDYLN